VVKEDLLNNYLYFYREMEIAGLYKLYLANPLIQTDTRKLQPGGMYFALSGANFDGNTFAQQALDAGVAYAVVDNAAYAHSDKCIVVNDALTTLQQLAKYHRQQFAIPFIGITGSNGKTTTKELIAAVLRSRFITYATEGNLNNHIGVPLTLLKIKQAAQMAIIEMGANHQKEIASYCEVALPTHAIITNCGKAHIEGFGGIEGVRKGKGELYDFIRANDGIVFRNTDLDYLQEMAHDIRQQITYGSANAEYIGKPIMNGVFLDIAMLTTHTETILHTQLVGDYNFTNVMAAVAVGLYFGISIDEIKKAIAGYSPDNSRSQWLQKGSNRIILDAYNANPTSMRAAIINFAEAHLPNKILWLGGMKEMGGEELNEHRELVALIDKYQWQDVLLVGKEFKEVQGAYKWFDNSVEAAAYVKAHQPQGSSILLKGSRGSKMEVLTEEM
jgi:UDP-N-acetylmuramoyl-tripeptide--D-alanyl-D-alanine ligase